MLVIRRKPGEKLIMRAGDDVIEITLMEMAHGRVCLGIEAPRKVEIWRSEIDPRQPQNNGKESS
jgi:carbon storage regulator CsrA